MKRWILKKLHSLLSKLTEREFTKRVTRMPPPVEERPFLSDAEERRLIEMELWGRHW